MSIAAPIEGRKGRAALEVRDLRTHFVTRAGVARAVDGVSFVLRSGRTLGLVGESGGGKTVTALSVLRLLAPPGRVVGGHVLYDGRDLLTLPERALRAVRGGRIAMVFQEPIAALNPVMTVGAQIAEVVRAHRRVSRRAAWARAVEVLRLVEIPDAAARAASYPHELSGGMCQRVMIAMAVACEPDVLIADEPTTALDVTIQSQVLTLIRALRDRLGMAVLLVTHDLGVIAQHADEVAVMYAGRIVEQAPVETLFGRPVHPYTRALLGAARGHAAGSREALAAIPGAAPDLFALPSGCRYRERCPVAVAACAATDPALDERAPGHRVACLLP